MTTNVREDRRRYLDHREHLLWCDIRYYWEKKNIDWLEAKCREIRATRRQREQLEQE